MQQTIYGQFIACPFASGDGVGGSEKYIGEFETKELCQGNVTTKEPTANGVTYGVHGQDYARECYAEFGKTNSESSNKWISCKFEGRIVSIYLYYRNT